MRRRRVFGIAVALSAITIGTAKYPPFAEVPVERLVANLRATLKTNRKDPATLYALGRVLYISFCNPERKKIRLFQETTTEFLNHSSRDDWARTKPTGEPASIAAIRMSILTLGLAVHYDGGKSKGLYPLTLACAYEASMPFASKIRPHPQERTWRELAVANYLNAFDQAVKLDQKEVESTPAGGLERSWISVEAGEGILRLAPAHPRGKEIRTHLSSMAKLPLAPVTPIIFTLRPGRHLPDLLDPRRVVPFNLDGSGRTQLWSWVKPDTYFLVWQPTPSRKITSGTQLFGSATWWMKFNDGYAALAALDDNRDGWLAAKELKGIAAWRDENQNGKCDSGEVRTLASLGIVGISTHWSDKSGQSLVSPAGLKLVGGSALPTYDWIVDPVK